MESRKRETQMSGGPIINDDDSRRTALQRAVDIMGQATDAETERELAELTDAIAEYDSRKAKSAAANPSSDMPISKE